MAGRLDGKVALISGGARGMGAAFARLFVEEGANVVIADIEDESGTAIARELGSAARYVHLDVSSYTEWEQAVAEAVDAFDGLDILVNNAGLLVWAPIEEHSIEDWDRVLQVNLSGAFYGIKAAIPALRQRGAGSIVNISSTAGIQGWESLAAYSASKFGIRGLTKNAALDLARYGIRVNSVHPGTIETPMSRDTQSSVDHVAMQRRGEPIEIARLVLFLSSDESSFSTGAEFVADGGETAGLAHKVEVTG
ncbi:glucose 1-dehydrogenase [Leucobacter japonicus]|uniref:glucose 1-dehydrogenase n=1 Tax=Leucobacter japonicus TaxID=1461259 RepID=UPI0006A7CDB6|nr:glucose 1-dehydrogenase [Leucobacter japonicus]